MAAATPTASASVTPAAEAADALVMLGSGPNDDVSSSLNWSQESQDDGAASAVVDRMRRNSI